MSAESFGPKRPVDVSLEVRPLFIMNTKKCNGIDNNNLIEEEKYDEVLPHFGGKAAQEFNWSHCNSKDSDSMMIKPGLYSAKKVK